MTAKRNIMHLGPKALANLFAEWGEPSFRSKQVFQWLWKQRAQSFAEMTNVSKPLRERLESEFEIKQLKLATKQESADGTIKHLFMLDDFKTVETVWIPRADQDRVTVCVSSQVGCKMGCTFCMTGQQKVERNLTAGEIAAQLLSMPTHARITNVVLMGMGEPFDNYDEVMEAIEIMSDQDALGIGPKKITVSTSGLLPKIQHFLMNSRSRLAISLNAPNNEIRTKIMPINKAYPIEKLLGGIKETIKVMPNKPRDFNITWEYILIDEVNDQPEHAHQLGKLLRGIPSKVNLLLYNENPNIDFKRPKEKNVAAFRQVLSQYGLLNFIRSSRGRDIAAACGQLASEHVRKEKPPLKLDAHYLS
ncbi:23S rRNA (adenine(2503)-C(2))-methyltransferase RlmN [bacterium]|nr:23S rRNA (adenine(2503)-C(2))-methyltransferase RlmN [bacterium]